MVILLFNFSPVPSERCIENVIQCEVQMWVKSYMSFDTLNGTFQFNDLCNGTEQYYYLLLFLTKSDHVPVWDKTMHRTKANLPACFGRTTGRF
uniref:Uncharacterized protein n=1 Tax=Arundo donax TaxID=35708 RepID=A0A0A9DW76_ARUDO